MQRTIVIRRDYLHYIRKYNRFEKRHRNMSVHLSPCFRFVRIILKSYYEDYMMIMTTVFWNIIWSSLFVFWKKIKFYICDSFFSFIIYYYINVYYRDVEIGDVVTIGECRPLSKTVRFNVLKVSKGTGSKKSFKKF